MSDISGCTPDSTPDLSFLLNIPNLANQPMSVDILHHRTLFVIRIGGHIVGTATNAQDASILEGQIGQYILDYKLSKDDIH